MHKMKKVMMTGRGVFLVVMSFCLAPAIHGQYFEGNDPGSDYQCQNPSPQVSSIWQAFDIYVKGAYGKKNAVVGLDRAYAYGHALGRLAQAHDNNAEKLQAVSCVQLAMEQLFGNAQAYLGTREPGRIARETSLGYHDKIVAEKYGVYDRRPLHEVFEAALKLSGRTQYSGSSGSYYQVARGNPYTTNSRYGTNSSGSGPDIISSTSPGVNGVDQPCMTGDRGAGIEPWSLMTGLQLINRARGMGEQLVGTCSGDNWYICRDINDLLHQARDHIFQVFDQNNDGVANCRLCNYDRAHEAAGLLVWWETWLGERYYNASGLGNIQQTIAGNMSDPLCSIRVNPVDIPVGGGSNGGGKTTYPAIDPIQSRTHVCGLKEYPSRASWKFYRYMYGGGDRSYQERDGYVCMGRTSYRKITGSSWDEYKCDYKWENCKLVPNLSKSIVEVKSNYAGPGVVKYGYDKGYGVRTPK